MAFLRKRGKKGIYRIIDKSRKLDETLKTNIKSVAEAALHRYELNKAEGEQGLPISGKTWSEFRAEMLDIIKNTMAYSTYQKYLNAFNQFERIVEPGLINKIKAYHIEKYQSQRAAEVQPQTINKEMACLGPAFEKALRWEYITKDPTLEVEALETHEEEPVCLDRSQQNAILSAAKGAKYDLYFIILLFLGTGLRLREALHLRWEDIDLKNLRLQVSPQKCDCADCLKRGGFYRPKSKTSQKPIPLFDEDLILELKKRWKPAGRLVPVPLRTLQDNLKKIYKKIGLSKGLAHTFRHSFITNLVEDNVNIRVIQEVGRHKNLNTTQRYAHVRENMVRQELAKYKRRQDVDNDAPAPH